MACLKAPALQGYLEEPEPSPLRRIVEKRLADCARCRSTFDRVLSTNRRVNSWLAKLPLPADDIQADAGPALVRLLDRAEAERLFASNTARGTNPRALAWSFLFQAAIVALLMSISTSNPVRTKIAQITLLAPPPAAKPTKPRTAAGGGGGQHSPLPLQKGQLPKPAPPAFTPPTRLVEHAELTILDSPEGWNAPTGAIGNPLGGLVGGGGPGEKGGIGAGTGTGLGDNAGPGFGPGGDAGIYSAGGAVKPPAVLSQVDPEYSEEARKAHYSGSVMLSIVVNTDGRADDIRVVNSLGMGLDQKAVEAVQKWRFRPGTSQGVPVRVRAQIQVNFRLL